MERSELGLCGKKIHCFLPDGAAPKLPLFVVHEMEENLPDEKDLAPFSSAVVYICGCDWENDFSPWMAPKIFKKGRDFGGGADLYLKDLTEKILPAAEKRLCDMSRKELSFSSRLVAGYSLSGLFSLYSLYRTDLFTSAVAASASLWYPGFLQFAAKTPFAAPPSYIYLSVGEREDKSGGATSSVRRNMEEYQKICQKLSIPTDLEINPGGHFNNAKERLLKGLLLARSHLL